MVLKTF